MSSQMLKEKLDKFLGKDTRIQEVSNDNDTQEVCDLELIEK